MATNNSTLLKKMFTFSDMNVRNFIEEILIQDAEERGMSQSAIIEEYILQGIARSHPEVANQAKQLYGKRYVKYLDPFMLNQNMTIQEDSKQYGTN